MRLEGTGLQVGFHSSEGDAWSDKSLIKRLNTERQLSPSLVSGPEGLSFHSRVSPSYLLEHPAPKTK